MNLAIGADHAGFHLKEAIRQYFERREHYFVDCGTFDPFERVDYPDYAKKVCEAVLSHEASFGILVCGTGIGMSIAANKFPEYARHWRATPIWRNWRARTTTPTSSRSAAG